MKVYAYYYRSDSGDEFLEIEKSDKELNVYEAMEHFGWECMSCWDLEDDEGYDGIPYAEFMVQSLDD